MPSERSFIDRIQRAEELHTAVTAITPAYAPADARFSLAALSAGITAAKAANQAVDEALPPYQDEVTERAAIIKLINPLITQSLAYVKSNTAWAKRYDAVKDLADKVRGVTPPRVKASSPEPDKKTRNRGEQSYVEIAAHLKRYIARLEGLSGYAPPDAKISLATLTAHLTTLSELNQTLPAHAQTLADAIVDRQEAYTGATGLKFVFAGVKTSVKGQSGQSSLPFTSLRGRRW
jgi:hypothetical protein